MKNYLRRNTDIEEYKIEKVIEPSDMRIDHAHLSTGTALVLSNAATALVCPRMSTRMNLVEHKLLLEPTIFGTALSGEIPRELRDQSRVIQAMCATPKVHTDDSSVYNSHGDIHTELGYQKEVLEDEIKFLWDKYTLGIFIHEVHDDDLLAIERLEGSMKHLDSGQFEVNLPFNGKLSLLPSNRELSVARTYKQIRDMANNEKYRTLVVKN